MWNYRKLVVWQRARALAGDVYRVTDAWPIEERYGLTSQLRRAAVSVGANIAEGSGRRSHREYAQFLGFAIGSLNEVDHHLVLAMDIGLAMPASPDLSAEVTELGKMLHALRQTHLQRAVEANE